jgi:hypothetical protein
LESDPKRKLKVTTKPLTSLWADTSKHMVFMVWEPRWATWEGSEIIHASAYAFGAYFFRLLETFVNFGVKLMPTLECSFLPSCLQMAPFLDKAPTSRHSGVREGLGCAPCSAMRPQGAQTRVRNQGSGRIISCVLWPKFSFCLTFCRMMSHSLPTIVHQVRLPPRGPRP